MYAYAPALEAAATTVFTALLRAWQGVSESLKQMDRNESKDLVTSHSVKLKDTRRHALGFKETKKK
jgi:hypothetical protein